MKALVALLLSTVISPILLAQTRQQPKPESTPAHNINPIQILELPKRAPYKPGLTLQDALKIADRYIVKENIDISKYYLLEAKYILYGTKDNQDPSWYFVEPERGERVSQLDSSGDACLNSRRRVNSNVGRY